MRESKINLEGINYKKALIYLKTDNEVCGYSGCLHLRNTPKKACQNRGPLPSIESEVTDDKKEWWWFQTTPEKPDNDQKKLGLGCVIKSMFTAVFSNRFYEWDGRTFRQKYGGPIGLRATQPLSRIVMDKWVALMRDIQKKTKAIKAINLVIFDCLDHKTLLKYVDDCFLGTKTLRWGSKWSH